MVLMFTRVTRLLESQNLCSHSVLKLHEATQMFVSVDYVRKMTVRSSVSMANMDHLNICSSCVLFYFVFVFVSNELTKVRSFPVVRSMNRRTGLIA